MCYSLDLESRVMKKKNERQILHVQTGKYISSLDVCSCKATRWSDMDIKHIENKENIIRIILYMLIKLHYEYILL